MIAVAKVEKMTILEQQVKKKIFLQVFLNNKSFSYVNVIMNLFNVKMNI
jgi:hypothetical protein